MAVLEGLALAGLYIAGSALLFVVLDRWLKVGR